jgi:hypothetical protein
MGSTISVGRSSAATAVVTTTTICFLVFCLRQPFHSAVIVEAFTSTVVPFSAVRISSASVSQLGLAFRNFHSDGNGLGSAASMRGAQSERERRDEQQRAYERHKERRQQFEQRQQQQRIEREAKQTFEFERRQEEERQARIAGSISFIALHEHEEELKKEQQKFEVERADLQKLISEQRRQLDALRHSETKLRCKQQLQLGHYNHYADNTHLSNQSGDHETNERGPRSSNSGNLPSPSSSLGAIPKPTADINLSMLWSENQNDKMKRITNRLRLLKEENERLTEQLEIEKTRFAVEKVFMEQKLMERDAEVEEAKDELRIEREMFKTAISLLEINLEREQKKVRALEEAMAQQRNLGGDPVQEQGTEGQGYQQQQQAQSETKPRGQVPGSAAEYHQQTQQQSSQHQHLEQQAQDHLQGHNTESTESSYYEQTQQQSLQKEQDTEIPIIDPEPYNTPYGRRKRWQQQPTKTVNFKYYQPPDQQQYHNQPEPNHQYRYYQPKSTQNQQYQTADQQYAAHNHDNQNYDEYNTGGASSAFEATGSAASSSSSSSSHYNPSAPTSSEDEDYYSFKSYRASPSQQRRANSAMPRSMRPDQPYPNGGNVGSQPRHNNGTARRYRNYNGSSSSSSSSTSGNRFRTMGDFGNHFFF